ARGDAVGSGDRLAVHVELDVARHEQVEAPVVVVVPPGGSGGPAAQGHAGFFGDVGEGAVVGVAGKPGLAGIRHVQVRPAVVVEIPDRYGEAPALVGHSRLFGDVRESAVVVVAQEHGARSGLLALEGCEGRTVHQVDVQPAVVVEVQQRDSRTG